MLRADTRKLVRQLLMVGILIGCLCFILYRPPSSVLADACTDSCGNEYSSCTSYCDSQSYDCWNSGYWNCDTERHNCYNSCDTQYNSCLDTCNSSGGGGEPPPGHGHAYCDGWDMKGDCIFNYLTEGSNTNLIFRRQAGSGGYYGQSFLSWHLAEMDGFGRFPTQDGSVGIVSNGPVLPGQVPLYRWSTPKGFYYSIHFTNHGSGYVYGGVAAYVYPPGDTRGFPLYQFYNTSYGHFYTNYKNEVSCQPPGGSGWIDQGEMARVNFPAPFSQAIRSCGSTIDIPRPCDAFAAFRCQNRGAVWLGNCTCSDGLP